jgi:hypothetical protein
MARRVVAGLSPAQCTSLTATTAACCTPDENGCLVIDVDQSSRLSLNGKGYVQIKVPFDPNHHDPEMRTAAACKNKKVQLQQLVLWMHALGGSYPNRQQIEEAKLEVSHLCHNKLCANPNHLALEDSLTNKSRNYCEVVVRLRQVPFSICRHRPRCVATRAKLEAALPLP